MAPAKTHTKNVENGQREKRKKKKWKKKQIEERCATFINRHTVHNGSSVGATKKKWKETISSDALSRRKFTNANASAWFHVFYLSVPVFGSLHHHVFCPSSLLCLSSSTLIGHHIQFTDVMAFSKTNYFFSPAAKVSNPCDGWTVCDKHTWRTLQNITFGLDKIREKLNATFVVRFCSVAVKMPIYSHHRKPKKKKLN